MAKSKTKLSPEEIQKLIPLVRNTQWQYKLDQYTDEALKEINKSVERARREITTKLQQIKPTSKFTKERLDALSTELQDVSMGVQAQITGEIEQVATSAGAASYKTHNSIMSFDGKIPNFNPVSVSAAQLHSMINTPIGGKKLNEWVQSTFDTNIQDSIKSEIMTGMLKGESYKDMVKRFDGTLVRGLGNDVEALTKTYVQSINVNAAQDVAKANADIVSGWSWNSTAENRTCVQCYSLDSKGLVYKIGEGPAMPAHPRCFLSKKVPIYTSKGWKGIGDVKIGDLVLTHKNRFRKVYATPRSKQMAPETVRIEFSKVASAGLSITANHQVQIGKPGVSITRWKAAKDCKAGDHIMMMANRCQRCGKLIPYTQKYCGHACVSKDITDKQWADPKHRVVCNHTGKYETVPYPITSVTMKKYRGTWPLFNLSVEEDESYIARGVVVHNCRCFPEMVTKTFREMGLDIDEIEESYRPWTIRGEGIEVSTGKVYRKVGGRDGVISVGRFLGTYEDFLKTQTSEIQSQILGPGRYKLWKSGKVSLGNMTTKEGKQKLIAELIKEVKSKKVKKGGPSGAVKKLAEKRYQELEVKTLQGWQKQSGSTGAQLLQEIANTEFLKGKGFVYREYDYYFNPKDLRDGKKYIKELYSKTQEALKKEGIEKITLYRGTQTEITTESVLSSWTTDKKMAKHFNGYEVIEREVDSKDILTYHKLWNDPKYPEQLEYVVITR